MQQLGVFSTNVMKKKCSIFNSSISHWQKCRYLYRELPTSLQMGTFDLFPLSPHFLSSLLSLGHKGKITTLSCPQKRDISKGYFTEMTKNNFWFHPLAPIVVDVDNPWTVVRGLTFKKELISPVWIFLWLKYADTLFGKCSHKYDFATTSILNKAHTLCFLCLRADLFKQWEVHQICSLRSRSSHVVFSERIPRSIQDRNVKENTARDNIGHSYLYQSYNLFKYISFLNIYMYLTPIW